MQVGEYARLGCEGDVMCRRGFLGEESLQGHLPTERVSADGWMSEIRHMRAKVRGGKAERRREDWIKADMGHAIDECSLPFGHIRPPRVSKSFVVLSWDDG